MALSDLWATLLSLSLPGRPSICPSFIPEMDLPTLRDAKRYAKKEREATLNIPGDIFSFA